VLLSAAMLILYLNHTRHDATTGQVCQLHDSMKGKLLPAAVYAVTNPLFVKVRRPHLAAGLVCLVVCPSLAALQRVVNNYFSSRGNTGHTCCAYRHLDRLVARRCCHGSAARLCTRRASRSSEAQPSWRQRWVPNLRASSTLYAWPLPCCAAVDAPSLCRPCGWARCVRVWVCGCASPVNGNDAPTRIAGQAACGSG